MPTGDGRQVFWTALFLPPSTMAAVPTTFSSRPPASIVPNPSPPATPSPAFLSVLQPGDLPDILLTGTFIAGGNTKPIYTVQMKGGVYARESWELLGWRPGVTSDIEIDQSAQAPNNRTRLDPDSITLGLSWLKVTPVQRWNVYGLLTQVDLPKGEFARSGPASDIIGGFLTRMVLAKPGKFSKNVYLKLYPAFGLETGFNLNRPSELNGATIDLSHYFGIVRGVTGLDASFGIGSADRSTTVFSILGSYRLRLPAEDEPFVYTQHGQTFAYNASKARHAVEVDVTWSPWSFQYLGFTSKYLWGSLPPIFNLVDHQVTVGFTIQADKLRSPRFRPNKSIKRV